MLALVFAFGNTVARELTLSLRAELDWEHVKKRDRTSTYAPASYPTS